MITVYGLQKLGFTPEVDFILQDDGQGVYIREWMSASSQPTDAEIEAAHAEYLAEKASTEYVEKRAAEYPPIGDQLDALLKEFNYRRMNGENLVADLDSVIGDWLAVKARHPKP